MIKKIILHFWSIRRQFFRYFLVGFSGLFLDMGSLYLLSDIWHVAPYLAVVINGIFMINYIFFLNKHWTFKSRGVTHKQIVRFLILSGFNYLVSIGWMFVFNEKHGINHLLARLLNIVLSVAWNFMLYKYWVYKHGEIPPLSASGPTQV